ncbi:MAG: hypothetical protein A2504_03555 [Bdellovibrionales bacterium RIFOXYD12_FULL_39_22]|nr:MAG: hypothetical protein A2385_11305 [Bdellovibrionales bacterium RIFOXYB1_FULL_39_21]OFZ41656.1 MAG: hypothetical protein A2485_01615 [Bdellovibrionales bacterium RIFOXYC12_FULL_39_17]OFZ46056.1 MAG: hypothetical protein A2404_11980 [Bdellovibrionales bacterium RIFOXYC1_FULL_39_130]OFZ74883.1 MAG: hypothetical protein A2560_15020 [Bdellovibrionales bacterium RIFOXYD1_FULL_39_84]OFZ92736.1 MAG: hypothetical protein A2504_03555 [Bdellovibrionales bacterium RIFOXYD12_FULL_39_22]HLE12517.1 hy
MATCKFCRKEITWIKDGRRNVPINSDGGTHRCEEMEISMKSIRQIEVSSLPSEEIKKYESAINAKIKK